MKHLLTILFTVALFTVNAQLIVKEAAKDTVIWQATKLSAVPKILKFTSGEEVSYSIYYRNAKYTSITSIDYLNTGDLETTRQFYKLCESVILDGKEYNIQLDGKSILLSKSMGNVMVFQSNTYFYLSEKWILSILSSL